MEIINSGIEKYIEEHTSDISDVLNKLYRETHIKILRPRMLSGAVQAKYLELLVKMIKPNRILEIGTYTGYSAISMASAIGTNAHLHTIDINEELESIVKKYISLAHLENKITYHIGNALEIIPKLNEKFDLIFIDADKNNYLNYYKLLIDKIPSGAWIVADNVLWSGKILNKNIVKDKDTKGLLEFNDYVYKDDRTENVIIPLRDGLMIIRKK